MLENAVYSVISPESCAAIIWRDSSKAALAAQALRLTAQDLLSFGLVDEIIPEPPEGAQADPDQAAGFVRDALRRSLAELSGLSANELIEQRYAKFRSMGAFFTEPES
jgi:acetyl-CoA carboxylase carboxyl transferase subunit alpha